MLPFFRTSRSRHRHQAEKPLRAEILSKDLLARRAIELAEFHAQTSVGGRGARLRSRFRENCKILNEAYFAFAEAARNKELLAAGAEWLLDNFHVIDEQVRDIRRDLPRSYYRALPKLTTGEWKGYPRVYQIVCEFISHTDAIVETEPLTTFIEAYQTKSVLLIGEIWAIPIMLRLALVENLRRLAENGLIVSEHRREAEQLCRDVIDQPGVGGADMLMALVNRVNQDPDILDYAAAQLLRRLRTKGGPAALSVQWLDEQLRERGIDPNEVTRIEQQSQAAGQLSVGNSVTALKTVGSLNWRDWFERVSLVDSTLRRDPAFVYGSSDFITRDFYRHRIEKLARRTQSSEVDVAQSLVEFAEKRAKKDEAKGVADERYRHVGYYLIDDGQSEFERALGLETSPLLFLRRFIKHRILRFYLGSVGLVTASGLLLAAFYSYQVQAPLWWYFFSSLVFLLPLSEFSIHVVHWLTTKFVPPRPLPKRNFEDGVPTSARTTVVIQTIVGDREALERTIETLEIRAVGNQDENVAFGILADLADSHSEVLPGDIGIINRAKELIGELNALYCEPGKERFFALFRYRKWNESEGKFIGWERKRGKISEYNRLLRGATDTSFNVFIGATDFLKQVRYVITLDNDSQLPPGVARKLIGAIDHPLNRALFDESTGMVIKGYSIIQPRVGITLLSATASRFAAVFSGHTGLDPYTLTVSDVYQDLFGEGSYIGKGVYDVDAFEKALHGRFPENALLSHDLIEGCFARCGLASDIEVFDEFPQRYHAQSKRQHRWIRGDWQLLPWLGRTIPNADRKKYVSPLSWLSWWKLFDNLRRSLVPFGLFLSLFIILAFSPGRSCVWFSGFAFMLGFPVVIIAWRLLFDLPIGYSISTFLYSLYTDFKKNTQLVVYNIILTPHQAFSALTAITVTLYRLLIGKKHLLEWETAAATERRLAGKFQDFWRMMWRAEVMVGVFALLYLSVNGTRMLAYPLFCGWLSAPALAWWLSRPKEMRTSVLSQEQKDYVRDLAFSTWSYFDTFLKPEYNYLIPDNLQIVPQRVVAERTSPTNISLSILSVLSAYDLGFVPLPHVLDRLSGVFETLARMEKFHGHYLNWYEIREARPLNPRYISTVDSGNFVGHLITARETLLKYPFFPLVNSQHFQFVARLLAQKGVLSGNAAKKIEEFSRPVKNLRDLAQCLLLVENFRAEINESTLSDGLTKLLDELGSLRELIDWVNSLAVLKRLGARGLLPKKLENVNQILEGRVPTLSLLVKLTNRLLRSQDIVDRASLEPTDREEFDQLLAKLGAANRRILALDKKIQSLCAQIDTIVDETDFKFLFDAQKKLFVIGYNIDNGQRDNSFYDLLASEARLASFVAIAKGDIPQSHWFLLNRALTDSPGGKALISWSGTMFEYLMPILVMRDYPMTLLSETYRAVVRTQRLYALRRGIPWGISESAYSGVDFEKTYQYRAFGIPGLGLKRGLAEDLVVSPYSTAMALVVDPVEALKNMKRLEQDGVRGEFGFFEAVDYTAERLGASESCHIVRSFLAHHQGMSLVSMNNLLNEDIFQERFHSNPTVRACELLLQERFPTRIPVILPHQAEVLSLKPVDQEAKTESTEYYKTPHTLHPHTRILSNGNYSIILDNSGNGVSTFRGDITLNRIREDSLSGDYGTFIYIRDLADNSYWSTAYQPARVEPESYEAIFNLDKVEYRRTDRGLRILTEVTVSPEDNVEVRRVTLTNVSQTLREIEVTSFGEVALASARADLAHPAFSKMFIRSEYLEDFDALIFTRRPRNEHDKELFMMHMVSMPVVWAPTQYETDREKFVGRGGSVHAPHALRDKQPLSGSVGTVLDPVFSLRNKVEVAIGESSTVCFVTGVAESRDELLMLVRKYREGQHITRAFEMAWSHSDVEIRHQHISRANVLDFQRLANALLFNIESLRAPAEVVRRSGLSQSGLWRFGVSGDEPIVLLVINDPEQLHLSQELLFAHEYLRKRGLRFDLVILNEYQSGYLQELQHELEFVVRTGFSRDLVDQRGGVFLRSIHQLSEEEMALLQSTARVVIYGNRGSFSSQLQSVFKTPATPLPRRAEPKRLESLPDAAVNSSEKAYFNGIGGFSVDGKSYRMRVSNSKLPPLPWVNVIANPEFGFLVSEVGSGYTWADNSRENRLSSWSNDPICDPPSEVIYLRDQESGEFWCPTLRPVFQNEEVDVEHGFGYSKFRNKVQHIESELTLSGSPTQQVKWWHLELTNHESRARRLEVFLYFEWVLGVARQDSYRFIRTGFDTDKQILYAANPFNIDFPQQVVFLGSNLNLHSYSTNRKEFIGRNRDLSSPALFEGGSGQASIGQRLKTGKPSVLSLSGSTGVGLDSCAVLKIQLDLPAHSKQHALFFLGKAENLGVAKERASEFRLIGTRNNALADVQKFWTSATGAVQIKTPSRRFDTLVNGWLQYQTLSCRILARSGFYQSSGALGFRDQLQDCMAFLLSQPEFARKQILLHASRQFVEGDVQHWWHPPSGRGIRTIISDNYLWLPFVVSEYLAITGDKSILEEQVSFLEGPQLEEGKADSYFTPQKASRTASLFEHCILALDRATKVGPHGIPLMGGGDWNDGMNLVGIGGKGESVWLGWFIAHSLKTFAKTVEVRGDLERAERYRQRSVQLVEAVEKHAWDGEWYRRAYFDDGTPLGSSQSQECQIDSLAQSWGVITGLAKAERQKRSMDSFYARLVDNEHRLIRLLWPPFEHNQPNPGYIQSYPPGLRENGGQYTHAAAWGVMAAAIKGDGAKAVELFDYINPISHTETAEGIACYKTEPYVTCGDVYTNPQHAGRGGWSWYTGSSGWLYRAAVEHIIGLQVEEGQEISLNPCVPPDWHEFSVDFLYRGVNFHFQVKNPHSVQRGVASMIVEGKEIPEKKIILAKYSGNINVIVEMG